MENEKEFQKRLLQTYREEALIHVEEMADSLLRMESTSGEQLREATEQLYRATHSLKGAARAVGSSQVELACQQLETIVAEVRVGAREFSASDYDVLQKSVEIIGQLDKGEGHDPVVSLPQVEELLNQLAEKKPAENIPAEDNLPDEEARDVVEGGAGELPVAADEPAEAGTSESIETVRIRVARLEDLMRTAQELLTAKQLCRHFVNSYSRLEENVSGSAQNEELAVLVAEMRGELDRTARTTTDAIDGVLSELRDVLMVPIGSLLRPLPFLVRSLAGEQGKRVETIVNDGGVEIDKRVVDEMHDGITHILRNCVDHGIESPRERLSAGKPEVGTIFISASQHESGKVTLTISDDGRGVDLDALRAAAKQQGSFIDDEQLIEQVFSPDVTTRKEASLLSGRGLGLSIVREAAEALGGTVTASTRPGQGTTISIVLPTHFARYQGVLTYDGGRPYLLPAANVVRVMGTSDPAVTSVTNTLSVNLEDSVMAVVRLRDLLGTASSSAQDGGGTILVVAAGDRRCAIMVDRVRENTEIVVRPLGPHLVRVRFVAGAAVMPDAEIVPVLNIHDVVNAAGEKKGVTVARVTDVSVKEAGPARVLIVEDSVTSRMLMRTILETAGYKTSTAKDGVEALQILRAEPYDLVVSDVDMPRMNGFVLTEKIRESAEHSNLPVVLVTALKSEEDRRRGLQAGADAYLTKSGFDQAELIQVIERLA